MIKNWFQYIKEDYNGDAIISDIEQQDIPEVLNVCAKVLGDVDSEEDVKEYLSSVTDWNISKKAVVGGKIVGAYLFNEQPITEFLEGCDCTTEDVSKYANLRGIQGLGLALLPECRGTGIGRKMRDIPLHMGYDYIWGQHLKSLHNIDQWLKFGRRVVADGMIGEDDLYVTLMDLK